MSTEAKGLADLTEEEFAELRARVGKMMENKEINLASTTMIYSRHLYGYARMELARVLAELGEEPYVEEFIAGAMATRAEETNEFTDQEILQRHTAHPLVFLSKMVERNLKTRQEESVAEQQGNEERRKAQPIPLGFTPSLDNPSGLLHRDRPLILVGNSLLIEQLLDCISCAQVHNPNSNEFKVVQMRFLSRVKDHSTSPGRNQERTEIGVNWSAATADNLKKFDQFMAQRRVWTFKKRLDLLLIEDMNTLSSEVVYQPWVIAMRVNRVLRQWADRANCGIVAGVPLEAYTVSDWKQVRTYADVAFLSLREDGGLMIRVGDSEPVWFQPHVVRDGK